MENCYPVNLPGMIQTKNNALTNNLIMCYPSALSTNHNIILKNISLLYNMWSLGNQIAAKIVCIVNKGGGNI